MPTVQDFAPTWVSHPGETIADLLKTRQISGNQFAFKIDTTVDRVEALLEGREAITIDLARRLHTVLGASVEFWMARDLQYREAVARKETAETKSWLSELPIADMVRYGWLSPPPLPSEEASACLSFFGVAHIAAWREAYSSLDQSVAFRTSPSLDSRPAAVAAWLRQGNLEASRCPCQPWNADRFRLALTSIRPLTRQKDPRVFLPALQNICSEVGVAVVVLRAPSGCRASGATQFISDDKALLLLSSRFLSDDQFWFTFFHEAGHLVLHGHRQVFLEGMDGTSAVEEEQANNFAAGVMISSAQQERLTRLRLDVSSVIRFARSVGIAPGIVVGQLQHSGRLRPNQLNSLKRRFEWTKTGLAIRERA